MKSTLENSGIDGNSLFISQKAILPVVARASNMGSSVLIQKALKIREDSIDSVLPGVTLPDPLPQNVQGIPDTILNPAELQITGYDTLEIVQRLASRELSCESVTKLAQKTVS
jgi:hypothetical protein